MAVTAGVLGLAGLGALIVATTFLIVAAATWDATPARRGCAWLAGCGLALAACNAAGRAWPAAAAFGAAAVLSAAAWLRLRAKRPRT
jgi:hypothetical protein